MLWKIIEDDLAEYNLLLICKCGQDRVRKKIRIRKGKI